MIRTIDRLRADEAGLSLAELLVAMMISSLALSLLAVMVSSSVRAEIFSRDDSASLDDMRIVAERITKEMRQGRLMYPDSTAYRAHFWVDFDLDNQQDADERIYWEVRDDGTGDWDLVRYTDADPTELVIAEFVVDEGDVFAYDPPFPGIVRLVDIAITFDVDPNERPVAHTVESSVRLRNAATP